MAKMHFPTSTIPLKTEDVLPLDFADNSWHITFDGAVKLADTYPDAQIICIHWGTVDAPDWNTFNGDPAHLAACVVNPGRVHALYPGEPFILNDKKNTSNNRP